MRRIPLTVIVPGLFLILVAGCGGGGGGSTTMYDGITSPAVLTDNNAETIAIQAYQAGDMSNQTGGIMPLSAGGGATAGAPAPQTIARLLEKAVESVALPASSAAVSSTPVANPMTVVTDGDTIYDGLGGSFSYSLSVDDQSGHFWGSVTFSNWHGDGGETISGGTSVSGSIDLGGGGMSDITFSFHTVTFTDGPGSFSISGSLTLTIGASSDTALFDMVLRDGTTGESVWAHDYQVTTTYGPDIDLDGEPDYVDTDLSGRIYLSNFGYVDVYSPVPFRYYTGYDIPSSGRLVATGDGGNSIRLTVIDGVPVSSGYYVEADLDGIPGYEWIGADHPWT